MATDIPTYRHYNCGHKGNKPKTIIMWFIGAFYPCPKCEGRLKGKAKRG